MPDENRCQHGMIRGTCAHCEAPPEYQMIDTQYPEVKEILHKGHSIHEFDKNFMFGKAKAKLFLACMDIVEELAATRGKEKPHIRDKEVTDVISGDRIDVRLESFLERSGGRRVNVPWVHLQSKNNPKVHIGLGRLKAKAIVALYRELAEWADYPLLDRQYNTSKSIDDRKVKANKNLKFVVRRKKV